LQKPQSRRSPMGFGWQGLVTLRPIMFPVWETWDITGVTSRKQSACVGLVKIA
jgi:hypothetical protein